MHSRHTRGDRHPSRVEAKNPALLSSRDGRCTTLRPMLEAGAELLGIANKLKDAKDAESATAWLLEYNAWCVKWNDFLKEYTVKDGKTARRISI